MLPGALTPGTKGHTLPLVIHQKCVQHTMELLLHSAAEALGCARQAVHEDLQDNQHIEYCRRLSINLSAEHHDVFITAARGLR